ncbi:MAG: hypothetical protein IKF49_02725 [Clostridia bacterium]|nr:hypothetical protein [Clostridia bacterium]
MTDDIRPYKALACAMVKQAVEDYRDAVHDLKYCKHKKKREAAAQMKEECLQFFRSDRFHILVDIDPEDIIEQLESEEKYDY